MSCQVKISLHLGKRDRGVVTRARRRLCGQEVRETGRERGMVERNGGRRVRGREAERVLDILCHTLVESILPAAPHKRSGMTGSRPRYGTAHANTLLNHPGKWKYGRRGRHVRESVRRPSHAS